jgi:hypothetical protein
MRCGSVFAVLALTDGDGGGVIIAHCVMYVNMIEGHADRVGGFSAGLLNLNAMRNASSHPGSLQC